MDIFYAYAYGTAAWLALQATPLLLTPRLVFAMLASDVRAMTALESYLSRSLGLALLAIALLNILLTGSVPLSNPGSESVTSDEGDAKAPYAYATLVVMTTYHALVGVYLYTQFQWSGGVGFGTGLLGSVALFCVGLWVVLFGSAKGHTSKSTGADTRTGNFPFRNAESSREKKKIMKKH